MPVFLLGAAIVFPIWLVVALLASPLLFFGRTKRIAKTIWGFFPALMRDAADPN